jgi:uncharacterized protein with HEPN domain
MPSRPAAAALRDIIHHVDLVDSFLDGLTFQEFTEDLRTLYAATRCLEIISEASRRLPADLKQRHTTIPWKDMAGAGNVYRHDYEDVAARFVWETVKRESPSLRSVIEQELVRDE